MEGINKESRVVNAIDVSHEFRGLLKKAAQDRGINMSSYSRRAIAAFIALDLDIPFEDVCATLPKAREPGLKKNFGREFEGAGLRDSGEGFGEWRIDKVV